MSDQNPVLQGNFSSMLGESTGKKKRGFASMDPTQVRELARRGGIAAHRVGTAQEFSGDEARVAGRKGGMAAHTGRRARGREELALRSDGPPLRKLPV